MQTPSTVLRMFSLTSCTSRCRLLTNEAVAKNSPITCVQRWLVEDWQSATTLPPTWSGLCCHAEVQQPFAKSLLYWTVGSTNVKAQLYNVAVLFNNVTFTWNILKIFFQPFCCQNGGTRKAPKSPCLLPVILQPTHNTNSRWQEIKGGDKYTKELGRSGYWVCAGNSLSAQLERAADADVTLSDALWQTQESIVYKPACSWQHIY